MKELRFQTSEKQSISLTENMDVAWFMSFAAEKSTVDPWTAKLLKRASRLLRETTGLYMTAMHNPEHGSTHSAEERLLRTIFERKDDDNDPDDETD